MKTFLALYRGSTVAAAELIAVTADPELVRHVSTQLLAAPRVPQDAVLAHVQRGKRSALREIRKETIRKDPSFRVLDKGPPEPPHAGEEGDPGGRL